jgi:putative transposase
MFKRLNSYKKYKTNAIAKYLKINSKTIHTAIQKYLFACTGSIIKLCRTKHPTQLLQTEVNAIQNMFATDAYMHWPLISIYYKGIRIKCFDFSSNTFYKYCKILQVRKQQLIKNYRAKVGKITNYPNQMWNADVTRFVTLDGVKHYIYLVMDNYSKKIIAWDIALTVNPNTRLQTFINAIAFAKNSFSQLSNIELLVDGGVENCNTTVDTYLAKLKIMIHKHIALKDTTYSNSAIEAMNKILKNAYLNTMQIQNGTQLRVMVSTIITEYNQVRPHGSLLGLTPAEAYQGLLHNAILIKQTSNAKATRIAGNKTSCGIC